MPKIALMNKARHVAGGAVRPIHVRSRCICSATVFRPQLVRWPGRPQWEIRVGAGGRRWGVLGADLQRDPRFNCRPYPARGAKGFKAKDLCDVLMTVATGKSGDISPSRLGARLRSHRDREIQGLCIAAAWDGACECGEAGGGRSAMVASS